MLKLGWFSTGRGEGSRKLLIAAQTKIDASSLDAQIACVFCNRAPDEDANTDLFLEQVRAYELPLVCLSSRDFRRARSAAVVRKGDPLPDWRREYDRGVMRLLDPYPFDVGVLAGYMLIFGEEASQRYDLLNLHPAAPGGPQGVWQDIIWQLIETRAETAGVMIHLATPELDEGPPVTYCSYPLNDPPFDPLWREVEGRTVDELKASEGEANRLFAEIRRRGVEREAPLVIETLRAFAAGRIRVVDKHLVDNSGSAVAAYDLTEEIERAVAATLA